MTGQPDDACSDKQSYRRRRLPEGIRKRHSPGCPTLAEKASACRCGGGYEAFVFSVRANRKIRKTFPTLAAARAWRADTLAGVRHGTISEPRPTTVREAAAALLAGMESGLVRNRSGDAYKPSVIRSYEAALRLRVLPDLGALKLSELQRRHVQLLINQMLAEGADPSTIRNTLMPLRVIFRQALDDGDVTVSPLANLRLPAVRGRRDRIVTPAEAEKLLAALPVEDRALWATALYAGLRRGELLALTWPNVNLATGRVHVEHSYDIRTRTVVSPKSDAGRRTVPIAGILRDHLDAHKARTSRQTGLVLGRTPAIPFDVGTKTDRARRAWAAAKLNPIGLHECRHTFASLMIAAGVNARALATYMGHASITITLDRYGHLMPGNENEAAGLLDAYLERTLAASTQTAR